MGSLITFTKEALLKLYALPFVTFIFFSVLLNLCFSYEKLIIGTNELIIKKPFRTLLRKKISLSEIRDIELQDEIKLHGYWGVRKGRNYKTYVAKLGNRIVLKTESKTYRFGIELSHPQGQFIRSLIEKSLG